MITETIYSTSRSQLLRWIDPSGRRVLDIGCGAGGLGASLLKAGAASVVGIEPSAAQAELALSAGYETVVQSSLEEALGKAALGSATFDVVILADVLEHLVDPWTSLSRVCAIHLTTDGELLISVPNVAHCSVIWQLVRRRRWRYDEEGIFDRTHLRWFGLPDILDMIEQSGMCVTSIGGRLRLRFRRRVLSRTVKRRAYIPSWLFYQYHVVAHRSRVAK